MSNQEKFDIRKINVCRAWLEFEKLGQATNCEKTLSAYGASHAQRGTHSTRKTVFFRCKSTDDAKRIRVAYPEAVTLGWETAPEEIKAATFMSEENQNQETEEMKKSATAKPAKNAGKPSKATKPEAAPEGATEGATPTATDEAPKTSKTLKEMKAELAQAGENLAALKSGKPVVEKPAKLTPAEKKAMKAAEKAKAKADKAAAKLAAKEAAKAAKALVVVTPAAPILASDRPVADIVAEFIQPVEGGLGYQIAPGLPVDQWVTVVRHLDRQSEAINFMVGDLLVYGEKTYGKTYDAAAIATGRSMKTLANWKSVAKGVAPEVRTLELSFTHHEAVSSLPAAKQTELLNKATEEKLSVADLRKLANDAKPPKPTPPPPATPPSPSSSNAGLQVTLSEEARAEFDKVCESADTVLTYLKSKDWTKLPQKDTDAVYTVLKGIAEKFAEAVNAGRFTKGK